LEGFEDALKNDQIPQVNLTTDSILETDVEVGVSQGSCLHDIN
jgi:hypothetical protein